MSEEKKETIQPYEKSSHHLPLNDIIFNNFLGGLMWALGATVGLSIFFTFLGLIAKDINLVPVVGTFVSNVINFILATNPHLQK